LCKGKEYLEQLVILRFAVEVIGQNEFNATNLKSSNINQFMPYCKEHSRMSRVQRNANLMEVEFCEQE